MNIDEFRVVLRARDFDATCNFYGKVMSLPRQRSWQTESVRGALFQAGSGLIEVLGRPDTGRRPERDEAFDYQGPKHKMSLTVYVASAEKAYEELIFREKNIPGGLKQLPDGAMAFETHDPDGVKILLREPFGQEE